MTQGRTLGAVCPTHNTPWFKTPKMRGFAHPIGDTGEWCNQPGTPAPTAQPTPESGPQHSRDDATPIAGVKAVRYGRTFNLGNYESSRMEMEMDFPTEMPDVDCFRELNRRLAQVKQALSPNVSQATEPSPNTQGEASDDDPPF